MNGYIEHSKEEHLHSVSKVAVPNCLTVIKRTYTFWDNHHGLMPANIARIAYILLGPPCSVCMTQWRHLPNDVGNDSGVQQQLLTYFYRYLFIEISYWLLITGMR